MFLTPGARARTRSRLRNAAFTQFVYTATASQTVFSGLDSFNHTLSYSTGSVIVTLNGDVLSPADYTATNGTSITLADVTSVGDTVSIVAFSAISAQPQTSAIQYSYTATAGQTVFSGADDNGHALAMGPAVLVALNGRILNPGPDFSTTATSVTLARPCT